MLGISSLESVNACSGLALVAKAGIYANQSSMTDLKGESLKGERYRDVNGATSVIALFSSSASLPLMSPSLLFDDSSRPDLVHMSAVLPMLIWPVSSWKSMT